MRPAATTTATKTQKLTQKKKQRFSAGFFLFEVKGIAPTPTRWQSVFMQPCPYVCLRAVFSTAGSAAAFAPAADHLISPPSPHICCPLTHLPAVQSAPLPIVSCQVVGFPRHGASASRCFFARRSRPVMNSLVFNLAPLSSRSQPSLLGSHPPPPPSASPSPQSPSFRVSFQTIFASLLSRSPPFVFVFNASALKGPQNTSTAE